MRQRWTASTVGRLVAWAVLLLGPGSAPLAGQTGGRAGGDEGISVVYLVRHAERAADHPSDPTLTPAGWARAGELARLLADAPLTRVLSTDLRRTVSTATPTAEAHGLELEFYDPRGEGMAHLVERLRSTPGHHLVVGHSNTTPALVEALGGDPVSAIDEMEYDRIYLVTVAPGGGVTSTLLRFGEPYHPEGGA